MKLLLDQGLPRSTVFHLREKGIEVIHVGECGLSSASDATILNFACTQNYVVVTLDADFHALLALSRSGRPSTIRIRIEGLKARDHAYLLTYVLFTCKAELEKGALLTVTEKGIRVRPLPLLR
jgi:predicted nuclease of predicted toxin-antitoxin system